MLRFVRYKESKFKIILNFNRFKMRIGEARHDGTRLVALEKQRQADLQIQGQHGLQRELQTSQTSQSYFVRPCLNNHVDR